ncbi:hypothetical protein L7F22_030033 [Adiantum nelumboides]|nr:hypothetical protein [Adiantum nelumboides]
MTAPKLLREFEKKYEQLSTREHQPLNVEKVELFIEAIDLPLQKILVKLLEETSRELGLTMDWKDVAEAIGVIVKRQKRYDKLKMPHFLVSEEEAKPGAPLPKVSPTLDEPILEELVKENIGAEFDNNKVK